MANIAYRIGAYIAIPLAAALSLAACGEEAPDTSGPSESSGDVVVVEDGADYIAGSALLNEPFAMADFDLNAILQSAEQARDACMEALSEPPPPNENYMPTAEQYGAMLDKLEALGLVAYEYNHDMRGSERALEFCAAARRGETAALSVYTLRNTGVNVESFSAKNGRVAVLDVYCDFPLPDGERNGPPAIGDVEECDAFELTEKGYLLYHYSDARGNDWNAGYRVLPLGGEMRALGEKYARYYDRDFDNIMMVNWDADNLGALHMMDVFEGLYYAENGAHAYRDYPEPYDTGEPLDEFLEEAHYAIPADVVEGILTKRLPVTAEALRAMPEYDEALGVYDLYMTPRGGYAPTPELVDVKENEDGSLALTFDAVAIEQGTDRAYGNTLTVRENEDGGVRYLSNTTDYWERNPYAHLMGMRVIPYPVSPEDQDAWDAADADYRRLCRAVSPWLMACAPDHLPLPGGPGDIQSRLRALTYLFENGIYTPLFDYEACLDAAAGVYRYPQMDIWPALRGLFPEDFSADSSYAIDYAERHGFLEERAYSVPAGDYGYEGHYLFGWADENEDGSTRITVSYSEDGEAMSAIQATFTIDMRGEPWRYLSVTTP